MTQTAAPQTGRPGRWAMSDPNDAIQNLARIAAAAARLMAHMHHAGAAVDPDEEIDHMRANLDHTATLVRLATR